MSRKQQQPQSQCKMTRKDALNVLYDLDQAYRDQLSWEEFVACKAFREQVREALYVLTDAVYGPRQLPQYPWLCEVCRHRRSEDYVHEKAKQSYDGTWCCRVCRDRLQGEGKLREDGKGALV
jgi:hypothetical protein